MSPTTLRLAAAILLTASSGGAYQLVHHPYPDHGKTSLAVDSYFGTASTHGALPFRITIRNDTDRDRTWTVRLSDGRPGGRTLATETVERIEIEAGGEVTRDVLARFSPSFTATNYRNLHVSATAPGLPEFQRSFSYQTNRDFPALAMSRPLARGSLTSLDEHVTNQNSYNKRFAEPFEVESLPDDWLAYTGLDGLLIDLASWRSLRDGQRRAILAWVRLGGRLEIYASSRTAPDATLTDLDIPGLAVDENDLDRATLSLGRVVLRPWNGKTIGTSATARYSSGHSRSAALANDFGHGWGLADAFGVRPFNPSWVFVPLVLFAVLVGPVNLFYFAGKGRRHRLFVTTPLISVGACLLIVLIILFQDGVGGRGMRAVLADLPSHSDAGRLYLTQEQVSRTGVMLGTGFTSEVPIDLGPVKLRQSRYNSIGTRGADPTTHRIDGEDFEGGYFPSRSEQGFSLRSVQPTRARIESTPAGEDADAPPRLVSSLPVALDTLFLRDERGRTWRTPPDAPPVAPGDDIPLQPADDGALVAWVAEKAEPFSENQRRHIRRLATTPGNRYFALPSEGDPFTIPTHDDLKWDDHTVLLTGHPTNRAADE